MEQNELINAENAEQQQETAAITPAAEEPAKSFSQEDVNRIIQERLARERERINSMINEDEGIRKELVENRLRLSAARELNASGYPIELVDLVDCTNEETSRDSIEKLSKVYDLAYKNAIGDIYRSNGREPGKGSVGAGAVEDKLREAFRPRE